MRVVGSHCQDMSPVGEMPSNRGSGVGVNMIRTLTVSRKETRNTNQLPLRQCLRQ